MGYKHDILGILAKMLTSIQLKQETHTHPFLPPEYNRLLTVLS